MSEKKNLTKEQEREAIIELYKQRDSDIEVIPITKKDRELLKVQEETVNVALYSRVSTSSLEQATSIALQEVSFEDIQKIHPNWKLVKQYTDDGISGTSIDRRQAFKEMIKDAHTGMFDLIVTRSVSRFARNLRDCVDTYQKLAKLPHPVYIYFVSNNLITNGKGEQSEMILQFMAMIAQEESRMKSEIMMGSVEQRYNSGKFLLTKCLGYDRIRESKTVPPMLIVNEEEAPTIKYMYGLLLAGHTCKAIASILMEEKRKTKLGNTKWTAATVMAVLENEKYYGAVIGRKTYSYDFLEHKRRKNTGQLRRYKKEGHHEPIVSKDVWMFAQKIIETQRKKRGGQISRTLHVIQEGILRGFVVIDRAWFGSSIDDYIEANRIVYAEVRERPKQIKFGTVSNFDLTGYESVSTLMFSNNDRPTMLFDYNTVIFNKMSLKRMQETEEIELLFNPKTFEIAVRSANKTIKTAVKWGCVSNRGNFIPYKTTLGSFTAILFDYMQWNGEYKYKLYGKCREHDGEKLLFFSLRDIEVFIPSEEKSINGRTKYKKYYPQTFVNQYGEDAYQSIYNSRSYLLDYFKVWDACVGSVAVKEDEIEEQMRKASSELLKS